jgi:hypothetical protein
MSSPECRGDKIQFPVAAEGAFQAQINRRDVPALRVFQVDPCDWRQRKLVSYAAEDDETEGELL